MMKNVVSGLTKVIRKQDACLVLCLLVGAISLNSCEEEDEFGLAPGLTGIVFDQLGIQLEGVAIRCFYSLYSLPLEPQVDSIKEPLTRLKRLPLELALTQNFPNPVSSSTFIRFSLPSESHIDLTVYDLSAQRIVYRYEDDLPYGFFQLYLENIVDSMQLRNGPYSYSLQVRDVNGRTETRTREMFVASSHSTPYGNTDSFGRFIFDYQHAFIGTIVYTTTDDTVSSPVVLSNRVMFYLSKAGFAPQFFTVSLLPHNILTRDIVMER